MGWSGDPDFPGATVAYNGVNGGTSTLNTSVFDLRVGSGDGGYFDVSLGDPATGFSWSTPGSSLSIGIGENRLRRGRGVS